MKGLKKDYERFRQAGAHVVTISADSANSLGEYRKAHSVPFIMLSDPERAVIKEYGVYNAGERGGIAIPAVFIIDRSGTITFAKVERTVLRVRNKILVKEIQKV